MTEFNSHAALRVALLAVLTGANPAFAQSEVADPVSGLDEIVVTADRQGKALRDIARSISVVNQSRIQDATQQLALDEALATVPGLYMQNRYNFAQDLRVSLRGFGARSAFGIRGVKVIVDGIPETLPDGQAGVDSIDLGSTRRIEVLRGPSSSLYGNASGGVIAIETERGPETPFIEGRFAAGDYGYEKYQLKTGGQAGALDYLFNVSTQELEGYRANSFAEGTLVNTRFGYQITENDRLAVTFNHTDQPTSDDPGGIDAAQAAADPRSARDRNVLFDTGEALDQQRLGLVYTMNRDAGDLTLRNYYVWRDFANKLPFTGGGAVDLDRFFYGFGAQYTLGRALPDGLDLTLGFDIERQDDERQRFDNDEGVIGALGFDQNEQVDANGFYLQASYELSDSVGLSAGLRYDDITFDINDNFTADGDDSGEVSFDQISPSIGLHVDVGNGMVFGNYSRSFETPTTTELANPDGSGGFNQALDPQVADNFEIGWKTGTAQSYFEVAVFRINLEDELIPFELPAFQGRTFFANAGESTRTGIETAYSWTGESGFGFDVSYTWSDFEFDDFTDDNGNDFSGNQLPGLPEQFGYLGLRYQNDRGLNVVWDNTYSGELFANNANTVEVSSYLVSSLRASYEFTNGDWRVQPFIGVNNLFDEEYNSNIRINAFGGRYFEPAPDRNIYAGVVINFQR
ncbi:MAG: TonB-dependent receptor [Pseudomonadota bacterium]